jgi:23S rRNA pseudouridine2605 synthase
MPEQRGERLQKVLAHAGLGSRRAVEAMIVAGRVKVNGSGARLGQRVDSSKDVVEVDSSRIPLGVDLVYYLANKPVGVVTTARDESGRATVLDLVEPAERVWSVGRLDADTEGALILCNDGHLTQRLTHPGYGVPKTYLAEVRGSVKGTTLRRLAGGVELDDGPSGPAGVALLDRLPGTSLVELTIHEGRNRQVRRMFEAVGHPVVRLSRTAIGPIGLGRLKPGTVRRLGPAEVRSLYRAVGL